MKQVHRGNGVMRLIFFLWNTKTSNGKRADVHITCDSSTLVLRMSMDDGDRLSSSDPSPSARLQPIPQKKKRYMPRLLDCPFFHNFSIKYMYGTNIPLYSNKIPSTRYA